MLNEKIIVVPPRPHPPTYAEIKTATQPHFRVYFTFSGSWFFHLTTPIRKWGSRVICDGNKVISLLSLSHPISWHERRGESQGRRSQISELPGDSSIRSWSPPTQRKVSFQYLHHCCWGSSISALGAPVHRTVRAFPRTKQDPYCL